MPDRRLAALILLASALSAGAQPGDRLLQSANDAYRSHRPGEAVSLYRRYLAEVGDRADVRVFLGAALLNLNRADESLDEARHAIRLNASSSRAHALAGRVYALERQWQLAEDSFSRAAALSPSDREIPYFRGRAFFEAGQFEAAVQQFSRAIELGARESRVQENLGLSLEALGAFEGAGAAYRKAAQAGDAGARTFYLLGVYLYKSNRLAESSRALSRSLSLAPDDVDTRVALGRTLYRAGELQQAADTLSSPGANGDCRVHNLLVQIDSAGRSEPETTAELGKLERCGRPEAP